MPSSSRIISPLRYVIETLPDHQDEAVAAVRTSRPERGRTALRARGCSSRLRAQPARETPRASALSRMHRRDARWSGLRACLSGEQREKQNRRRRRRGGSVETGGLLYSPCTPLACFCAAAALRSAAAVERIGAGAARDSIRFSVLRRQHRIPQSVPRRRDDVRRGCSRDGGDGAERSRHRVCRRLWQSAVRLGDRVRAGQAGAVADRARPAIVVRVRNAAAADERALRQGRIATVLTSCCRRSSARRSRTNGRTKPVSHGRSTAAISSITSGSNGSASTRPSIESGSTAGLRTSYRLSRLITLPLQFHVVHEGGQLYQSGAVADSRGDRRRRDRRRNDRRPVCGDARSVRAGIAPRSRSQPPELSRDGTAFFGRAAAERVRMARPRHFLARPELHQGRRRRELSVGRTKRRSISRHARLLGSGADAAVHACARGRARRVRPRAPRGGAVRVLVPDRERRVGVLEDPLIRTPWHLAQKKLRRAR